MLSRSGIRRVSKIWFLAKELLNFQRPFPRSIISFNSSEKTIEDWSVQKEARTSLFLANSCKVLGIRKKSSLHSVNPEKCLWRNLKHLMFGFLTLHISRKQKVYFISVSFARDFLIQGYPRTLYEKCPNTGFFLVRIFLYSVRIQTRKKSVFEHFSRSGTRRHFYCQKLN